MTSHRSSTLRWVTVLAVLLGAGLLSTATTLASNGWTTSDPFRVLDTRPGQSTIDGEFAGTGRIRAGTDLQLQLTGRVGIPTDVDAVLMNVTALGAASSGYVSIYPCDIPRPTAASLNVVAGDTRGNLVLAPVDARGRTCIYSSTSVDLVADVQSYTQQVVERIGPARVLDSRPTHRTIDGRFATSSKLPAGSTLAVQLAGRVGIPSGARTVMLNVTATETGANGFITVHPCRPQRPNSSNLNYTQASTQAAFVITELDADGRACVYTHAETHLVIDVQGYSTDAVTPIGPRRLLDSRPGHATFDGEGAGTGRRPARSTTELRLAGRAGIPADANTVFLNVTATDPSGNGFLTVHGCDDARPNASNVNYTAGATRGNVVVARVDGRGGTCIYTHAGAHIVVDVQGYIVGAATARPSEQVTPRPAPPVSAEQGVGFVHPGVLVDRAQLDEIRAHVAAGRQPWAGVVDRMYGSNSSTATELRPTTYRFSSLSYVPAPVSVILASSSGNQSYLDTHDLREVGDVEHIDDARAAYTHALLWAATGNQAHADKAIEIMNAWSSTLTEIKFDQPRRVDNGNIIWVDGKLHAGWGGSLFARAGEIIRYSNAGWTDNDITRFETMLRNVYLPLTIDGWSNGANWLMTLAEGTISIGVFLDDRAAFDAGIAMWRKMAPTTIYHPDDGPRPLPPASWMDTPAEIDDYWRNPDRYITGLQGEALRDLPHMMMGLGAMANAAETAYIQGIDLYGEQADRIIAGFELSAGYVNAYLDEIQRRGGTTPPSTWTPPNWPGDPGTFRTMGSTYHTAGWHVAHHHYTTRTTTTLPQTSRLVQRLAPNTAQAAHHMTWEPLTHTN